METGQLSQQFCEDLFETEEEKQIVSRLLAGAEDREIIREILGATTEESGS